MRDIYKIAYENELEDRRNFLNLRYKLYLFLAAFLISVIRLLEEFLDNGSFYYILMAIIICVSYGFFLSSYDSEDKRTERINRIANKLGLVKKCDNCMVGVYSALGKKKKFNFERNSVAFLVGYSFAYVFYLFCINLS